MSDTLDAYLVLSGILFAIGSFGFLARRNAISMLMSIELMLNAVNLVDRRVRRVHPAALGAQGSVIALMVMAVAAAEATVGLAIVIAIYRNKKTPLVDEYDAMRSEAVSSAPTAAMRRCRPRSLTQLGTLARCSRRLASARSTARKAVGD